MLYDARCSAESERGKCKRIRPNRWKRRKRFTRVSRCDAGRYAVGCPILGGQAAASSYFDDDTGTPNLCLLDVSGELLLVSQFTLCADARKGRRPSYAAAARPELAKTLYEAMAELLAKAVTVQTGVFRADMQVFSVNDGPLTILLDSRRQF